VYGEDKSGRTNIPGIEKSSPSELTWEHRKGGLLEGRKNVRLMLWGIIAEENGSKPRKASAAL